MAGARRGRSSSHAGDAESPEFGVMARLVCFDVKTDQLSNGVGFLTAHEHRNNPDSTRYSPRFFNRLPLRALASVSEYSHKCWRFLSV